MEVVRRSGRDVREMGVRETSPARLGLSVGLSYLQRRSVCWSRDSYGVEYQTFRSSSSVVIK